LTLFITEFILTPKLRERVRSWNYPDIRIFFCDRIFTRNLSATVHYTEKKNRKERQKFPLNERRAFLCLGSSCDLNNRGKVRDF